MEKLEAAIEAILFSAGDSVETGRIAKAIGQDKTTTEKIIRNMMLKYNARDRGIKILELDGAFQLCTKQEYYEYLVDVFRPGFTCLAVLWILRSSLRFHLRGSHTL